MDWSRPEWMICAQATCGRRNATRRWRSNGHFQVRATSRDCTDPLSGRSGRMTRASWSPRRDRAPVNAAMKRAQQQRSRAGIASRRARLHAPQHDDDCDRQHRGRSTHGNQKPIGHEALGLLSDWTRQGGGKFVPQDEIGPLAVFKRKAVGSEGGPLLSFEADQ